MHTQRAAAAAAETRCICITSHVRVRQPVLDCSGRHRGPIPLRSFLLHAAGGGGEGGFRRRRVSGWTARRTNTAREHGNVHARGERDVAASSGSVSWLVQRRGTRGTCKGEFTALPRTDASPVIVSSLLGGARQIYRRLVNWSCVAELEVAPWQQTFEFVMIDLIHFDLFIIYILSSLRSLERPRAK